MAGLNRAEALALAVKTVDEMAARVPLKPNGYAVDHWKPPTFTERTTAIMTMADFLWEPADLHEPESE